MLYFSKISLFFVSLLTLGAVATAVTDPEPNPFDKLASSETLIKAKVISTDSESLTVRTADGSDISGSWENIARYREGGGAADIREFAVGDSLRVIHDDSLIVVQNYDLALNGQDFFGKIEEVATDSFMLKTVENEQLKVWTGKVTQYCDETGETLYGYSARSGEAVRVHAVFNRNSRQLFTETLGAYIALVGDDSLEQLATEIAETVEAAELSAAADFSDVAEANRFRRAIGFVKKAGIVGGYDDGTYRPEQEINRAEFVKILAMSRFSAELESFVESESAEQFADIESEVWFAKFVNFARQKEILSGYDDGTFRPANLVNLAEVVKIVVKTFGWTVEAAEEGQAWYEPYFARAKKLDILPADFTDPASELTRGQMAELITRAMKYQSGDLVDYLEQTESATSNSETENAAE